MPLGLRIMQLGLGLINLTILSYLTKILIGHILCMVMLSDIYCDASVFIDPMLAANRPSHSISHMYLLKS